MLYTFAPLTTIKIIISTDNDTAIFATEDDPIFVASNIQEPLTGECLKNDKLR